MKSDRTIDTDELQIAGLRRHKRAMKVEAGRQYHVKQPNLKPSQGLTEQAESEEARPIHPLSSK